MGYKLLHKGLTDLLKGRTLFSVDIFKESHFFKIHLDCADSVRIDTPGCTSSEHSILRPTTPFVIDRVQVNVRADTLDINFMSLDCGVSVTLDREDFLKSIKGSIYNYY